MTRTSLAIPAVALLASFAAELANAQHSGLLNKEGNRREISAYARQSLVPAHAALRDDMEKTAVQEQAALGSAALPANRLRCEHQHGIPDAQWRCQPQGPQQ